MFICGMESINIVGVPHFKEDYLGAQGLHSLGPLALQHQSNFCQEQQIYKLTTSHSAWHFELIGRLFWTKVLLQFTIYNLSI